MSDPTAEVEKHLRKELGRRGSKGPLDAAPVESALAWLARRPTGVPAAYREALPMVTRLAQNAEPRDDDLRTNATRLVGRLYPLSEPIMPASVAFDPNAKPETIQRYKAERAAHHQQGRDVLLALAHDPVPMVAAAAALELLTTATVEERRALRGPLAAVAPTLEASAHEPEVALALVRLQGPAQVERLLADYAAHRPIPVALEQLADEARREPTPGAAAALEAAIVGDAAYRDPHFEPKQSSLSGALRMPVYDADTERLQQLLSAVDAADHARAEAIAAKAPPKLSARLQSYLKSRPKP